MANSGGYTFTKRSAERITRVVRDVERGGRDQPPVYFRQPVGDGGDPVRLCKTTEPWLRNTHAVLEVWESGDPPDEEITVSGDPPEIKTLDAFNKSYDVAACVWVLVAKGTNGHWYLVEAAVPDPSSGDCAAPNIGGHDLTTLEGYDSSKKQALTHDENACLMWVDIEECEP